MSDWTFPCGHPRTAANVFQRYNIVRGEKHFYDGCLTCKRANTARWNDKSSALRVAASHNRRHTGASQRIRDALKASGEKMSLDAITLATGLKREVARGAIHQMLGAGGSGGIIRTRDPFGVYHYAVYQPPKKDVAPAPGEEYRRAGPITYPNYRWGSSRLG